MRRHILTGAPGAGKTALLRALETQGYAVVEEAATDVIALAQARGEDEPWRREDFITQILDLQAQRLAGASAWPGAVQIHDRSAVCTLALCRFLDRPAPSVLAETLARLRREAVYQDRVLFVRNLGFCAPTAARRISFEESLRFEAVHEAVYREQGYDLVVIAPQTVDGRARQVMRQIGPPG